MGLFTPAWKTKKDWDPNSKQKALKAVERLGESPKDQVKLEKILMSAPIGEVAHSAALKINDQSVFLRVFEQSKIRLNKAISVAFIKDLPLLLEIVKDSQHSFDNTESPAAQNAVDSIVKNFEINTDIVEQILKHGSNWALHRFTYYLSYATGYGYRIGNNEEYLIKQRKLTASLSAWIEENEDKFQELLDCALSRDIVQNLRSLKLDITLIIKKGVKPTILDQYREGLSYLDGCRGFDEGRFRTFNQIIGNRFSEADIQNQLNNVKSMIGGMEDLRRTIRGSVVEAISTFEQLEKQGIDLSKFNV